jgi:hypothetical protein
MPFTALAKMFAARFQSLGPLRPALRASAQAILKSKKSCSLAKTQPVSEPRPVPIRLQGAFETGSRGATFA